MQAGLGRQCPDRMQGPALNGFTEHYIAGADRKPRPDEIAD